MADGTIATISGTMLVPGVSLNRRLYTKELIGKVVQRMQDRISDENGLPIVMRTHHDAGDDSTRIVGRITDATTDKSGAAKYRAALYDTAHGRDIASLTTPGAPALRSTSIHGYWLGPVRRVEHAGQTVETGDDLEVDAVDFTASPGVLGAVLDLRPSHPNESTLTRTAISESYDAQVAVTADAPDGVGEKSKPTPGGNYADPGYQKDGVKRYPLDTKEHVKAAWSYINMPKNAKLYTSGQVTKIKGRIKSAATKFGIKISDDENWLIDSGPVTEMYDDAMAMPPGSFCVSLSNGPVNVTVSSYTVDPEDLDVVARQAMAGACAALAVIDPDNDGDIDTPGKESVTVEVTGSLVDTEALATEISRVAAEQQSDTTPAVVVGESTTDREKEPSVADETTNEAATTTAAPTRTLTEADVTAIGQTVGAAFAAALKENMPAPVVAPAPAAEPTTPTATESTTKVDEGAAVKEAVTAALEEMKTGLAKTVSETVATETGKVRDELRETLKRAGVGTGRIGYRVHESDGGDPTPEQLFDNRADVLLGDFGKTPVPHAATGWAPSAQHS